MNNRMKNVLSKIIKSRESSLIGVLILVTIILSICTDAFLTSKNLLNIMKQVSLVTIVACGQTFIIISGGIDLSIGQILGFVSIIISLLLLIGVNLILAIFIALILGMIMGILNGVMITTLRLPPFIVTLGMASILKGLILVVTEGFPIKVENEFILALGQGYLGIIPIMAIVMILIVAVAMFILNKTVFGNRVKSIGGNETAAEFAGIKVKKNKVMIYGLAGLFASIGGIIITGRLNSGNPNAGLNFDMDSIAATIIGGTSMSGGSGSALGTFAGAVLLGVIRNGLVLLNVNMYWQTVVTGSIIIGVCALDQLGKQTNDAR